MAAPTLAELARRVLLEQTVIRIGEVPSAAKANDIITLMTSVHAEKMEKGEITWPLTDIPQHSEQAWVEYIAGRAANMSGVSFPEVLHKARQAEMVLIANSADPMDNRDIRVTDY